MAKFWSAFFAWALGKKGPVVWGFCFGMRTCGKVMNGNHFNLSEGRVEDIQRLVAGVLSLRFLG